MIEVENLTKKYGNHVAVDHLSFTIDKGMVYGFLGPNGAGKSTTMNMMTGYIASSEGIVKINGYDIVKNPEEAKKSIGYLPELPPVYQDMTVLEYLKFVAELKKVPRKERFDQINDIMEQTHISDVKNRLIKNLSKGYKQRVGLAQAIIGYPEVIILDEPSVGLDPKQIIEIRELIKELSKKHTVILSSHILSEVSAVCDHIMIISHGKLVASDTPEGLMTLFTQKPEVKVKVKGSNEELNKVLSGLESVESFTILDCKDEKCSSAVIIGKEGEDIREQLFYSLACQMLPIMELSVTEKSLEDVFIELTQDNKTAGDEKTSQEAVDSDDTQETTESEVQTEEISENETIIETQEGEDNDSNL